MSTHYQGSDQEKLILDTWIKFNRAKLTLDQCLRRNIEGLGLTLTQFGVMEILEHLGPLPMKTIGEKILMTSSNLVIVVDNLEKLGFVKREKNPDDRRSVLIHLTPAGKTRIKPVFQDHLQQLQALFQVLSESELQTLGSLCKTIGLNQQQ